MKTKYRCVYALECKGLYKIGKTDDLEKRVKSLETGNPFPMQVVHVIFTEQYHQVEGALHQMFAADRAKNEWFSLSVKDLAAIRSMSVEQILNTAQSMKPPATPSEPTVPPGQETFDW